MITKKQIIEIADTIKDIARDADGLIELSLVVDKFADYLAAQNPNFKRERFIAYVNGECGPNGGMV